MDWLIRAELEAARDIVPPYNADTDPQLAAA